MRAPITVITASHSIGKRYELEAGQLKKTTLGELWAGGYEVRHVSGLLELADLIGSLKPGQALSASVPRDGSESGEITTKKGRKNGSVAQMAVLSVRARRLTASV
ncbi:hypothetical protein, partial [Caldimonas tepidiphila]|uniref:hypothetical protein n=1 Tax=Caldimonas tepidiphila TaxID=2315841 RepID=UPI00196B2460